MVLTCLIPLFLQHTTIHTIPHHELVQALNSPHPRLSSQKNWVVKKWRKTDNFLLKTWEKKKDMNKDVTTKSFRGEGNLVWKILEAFSFHGEGALKLTNRYMDRCLFPLASRMCSPLWNRNFPNKNMILLALIFSSSRTGKTTFESTDEVWAVGCWDPP